MTIDDMRDRFRMLLASARQQDSATDALARRINCSLMVFDNRLYDLTSGDHELIAGGNNSDASAIADAAARLLQKSNTQPDTQCLLLLLPASEFLANQVKMPGLAPDAMRSALQLQAMTLLPEFDDPLNLALTNMGDSGKQVPSMAWWIPAARTSELFNAFSVHSLFVAAVLPRPAWFIKEIQQARHSRSVVLQESDSKMLTVVACDDGTEHEQHAPSVTCMQTTPDDLIDPVINEQWQAELLGNGIETVDYTVASAEEYLQLMQQYNLQPVNYQTTVLSAFPAPALAARHQLDRGRRQGLILKTLTAATALVLLPFLYQSWQLSRLQSQLEDIRILSADARMHQAEVREFEIQWGVLTEFPEQDVGATMVELQQVINPGVLTMFEIDQGFISIEGESQDPQNVLEQLEQNPMFTEVDFARATNNNRYFIDLRLTTVNFPAYQEWHFPESQ